MSTMKTVTAVSRYISVELKRQIDALVSVDWHEDPASTICDRLHAIGEHTIAHQLLEEIRESLSYQKS